MAEDDDYSAYFLDGNVIGDKTEDESKSESTLANHAEEMFLCMVGDDGADEADDAEAKASADADEAETNASEADEAETKAPGLDRKVPPAIWAAMSKEDKKKFLKKRRAARRMARSAAKKPNGGKKNKPKGKQNAKNRGGGKNHHGGKNRRGGNPLLPLQNFIDAVREAYDEYDADKPRARPRGGVTSVTVDGHWSMHKKLVEKLNAALQAEGYVDISACCNYKAFTHEGNKGTEIKIMVRYADQRLMSSLMEWGFSQEKEIDALLKKGVHFYKVVPTALVVQLEERELGRWKPDLCSRVISQIRIVNQLTRKLSRGKWKIGWINHEKNRDSEFLPGEWVLRSTMRYYNICQLATMEATAATMEAKAAAAEAKAAAEADRVLRYARQMEQLAGFAPHGAAAQPAGYQPTYLSPGERPQSAPY